MRQCSGRIGKVFTTMSLALLDYLWPFQHCAIDCTILQAFAKVH